MPLSFTVSSLRTGFTLLMYCTAGDWRFQAAMRSHYTQSASLGEVLGHSPDGSRGIKKGILTPLPQYQAFVGAAYHNRQPFDEVRNII